MSCDFNIYHKINLFYFLFFIFLVLWPRLRDGFNSFLKAKSGKERATPVIKQNLTRDKQTNTYNETKETARPINKVVKKKEKKSVFLFFKML